MPQDELEAIQRATAGLRYPSESDAPFEAIRWDAAGAAQDHVASLAKGRRVELVTPERFFLELRDSEDADRFGELRRVLEQRLQDLCIFRVGGGEVTVDIYIVGRSASGAWVGLHTTSVET